MSIFARSLLFLVGLVVVVNAALPLEDGVLVLDDTNFDEAIAAHDLLLVEFYAPWYSHHLIILQIFAFHLQSKHGCFILDIRMTRPPKNAFTIFNCRCGHCKTLAPEWAKAAKSLSASASPMKLAKVDATIAKKLAETNAVQGFPTIKFFKNGKAGDYSGGRTAPDIIDWANKKSGPAYITVTDGEGLQKIQDENEVIVLGVFESLDSAAASAFIAMASDSEDQVRSKSTVMQFATLSCSADLSI